MHKTLQRAAVIAAAAVAPMAITAAIAPAVSHADCDNGTWWDPVQNRCQAPLVQNCPGGWWDPNINNCRPPVATTPLDCRDGAWWDPINNICRPPLLPQ
ncbi:hypothetical protein FZI85_26030 [Mycobacterium sp. CBMA293]|uniref:hypothetical protein n=2 Tax=unclassified Mycolicibacterium TaxID=2636767 RepID=UPI0013297DD3|nr:hypothetical protein [Mycolicibacterium sp. CBMA 360]MUL61707.1 hypothetical protein [Mycolicibacterium sp. CBMA 335]MUL70771.1 hypothetical protein [Mycolicibacterium sp. CBMA 311]MUL97353.1 hypothetical protein [Mycolicibacterium sp. CBMA 230]MUM08556.1 hypothetical protein [Mycolicibacterium sp. CBMA 213]MUM14467.1 hypothetical protein [Mycolicibacterium sp. CBMA 293]MUM30630.1 hypothetical protein [Mycolicibacterium sp. CBMA 361]